MTRRYLPLLERLDAWQRKVDQSHPNLIPCRSGCSACCHGPFDISAADVATLADGFRLLDSETRAAVVAASRAQIGRVQAIEPNWQAPFDIAAIGEARFDKVSDSLATLPCPMLATDQRCLVYRHRPMVCRVIGIGLETESGEVIENACPIQGDYPAYAALAPQAFPLEAWEAEEEEEKTAAAIVLFGDAGRAGYETTIAGAVMTWMADQP